MVVPRKKFHRAGGLPRSTLQRPLSRAGALVGGAGPDLYLGPIEPSSLWSSWPHGSPSCGRRSRRSCRRPSAPPTQ